MRYENIRHMLRTVFSSDFCFSEDVAISIYVRSMASSGKRSEIRRELLEAFNEETLSWRDILVNDEYEVLDFESEEDAKAYVIRVLWDPLEY
ncbi:hypothetical protein SAMN03159376_04648 [Pseudomonas sp. NFACC09-4]|uniref:hypothetical protein n=1 Tax=unclassified Pseudomonas TaxID=196821 RepID=UPI000908E5C5|nr:MULTISPECIES: hypothetical protein [unclassified Pseudomonas]ROO39345.1 hypothetical protein BIV08_19000 [Pseudomonas sp. AF76]SFW85850.1 hypothetical protein SAMN03159376_04648 [Pseudomonas sp. NFACC09-4]SFX48314.1 hypothetical protein SAMN03159390_01603 [Pseudomonas sp. NFACC49-2]